MAYGRKTGGRQLGTTNKATSTLQTQVEEEAGAPLPVLLARIGIKAMNEGDHQLAVNALSKAATYTYPKVASVDHDGGRPGEGSSPIFYPPLVVDDEGKTTVPPNWPGVVIRFTRHSAKRERAAIQEESEGELSPLQNAGNLQGKVPL